MYDDDIEFESNDFGYDPNLSCSGVNSGQGQEFQLMRGTFLPPVLKVNAKMHI